MRQGAYHVVVRRCVRGLLAGGVVLAFAASAQAAAGVDVVFRGWMLVDENGAGCTVLPDRTCSYCKSNPVKVVMPIFTLGGNVKGKPESETIVGPPAAGSSAPSGREHIFRNGGLTFSPAFEAFDFPNLRKANVTTFPAGAYRYTLVIGGRLALTETIKLGPSARC